MFLNSSIGISEGVRATLFLRDCRKRNIIHGGGVDIKWNGPLRNVMVSLSLFVIERHSRVWLSRLLIHQSHQSKLPILSEIP